MTYTAAELIEMIASACGPNDPSNVKIEIYGRNTNGDSVSADVDILGLTTVLEAARIHMFVDAQ